MPTQPKKLLLDLQSDAELECLLFLAAALQVREQQGAELAVDSQPPQAPTFLGELQAMWKGLRKRNRKQTAQR
jgi:hypothetical protein